MYYTNFNGKRSGTTSYTASVVGGGTVPVIIDHSKSAVYKSMVVNPSQFVENSEAGGGRKAVGSSSWKFNHYNKEFWLTQHADGHVQKSKISGILSGENWSLINE